MKNLVVFIANFLLFSFAWVKSFKWRKSVKVVEEVQNKYLMDLLDSNKKTIFGVKYKFHSIRSVKEFQLNVPISSYEDFSNYIVRIADGEENVLTKEKICRFGVSSGSTSASKLIPYNEILLEEFQEGINPWFWFLIKKFPKILFGKTYWSITPIGQKVVYSDGHIPVGFDDDKMYLGRFARWVLNTIQLAPSELSLIKDIDVFRYATLRFLLEERNITWISIWNPTFIILCLSPLKKEIKHLIDDIENGTLSVCLGIDLEIEKSIKSKLKKNPKRALELKMLSQRWGEWEFISKDNEGHNFYELIWPKLQMISCWADGEASNVLPKLAMYFPSITIEPKGLIATEAFVSFPYKSEKSALSITSHFFEFESEEGKDKGKIFLADELSLHKEYSVIVTTGGGLYRYRLNDIIVVLGHERKCPLIRFLKRKDKVVDLFGEKLNEQFVKEVVLGVIEKFGICPKFWLVSPEQLSDDEFAYTFFIQNSDRDATDSILFKISEEIESKLLESYHYNYCRKLGQLGILRTFIISPDEDSDSVFLNSCLDFGQRLGDIKKSVLHSHKHWSKKFQGRFIY